MLETLIFREIRYNGNNEKFLKEIQGQVAKNPEDIDALQTLASTYHALKENEKAIEIYEKLVRLKPEDHEIRAFLGYLYYENDIRKPLRSIRPRLKLIQGMKDY